MMIPPAVIANMGSALMWGQVIHLSLGNLLLGVLEGLLIAWWLKEAPLRVILLMIAANFVSAFTGFWLLGVLQTGLLADLSLYEIPHWLSQVTLLAFVATLLLEWPFIALIVWMKRRAEGQRWLAASVVICLATHLLSYSLLFGWYVYLHDTSLLRGTRPMENLTAVAPKNAWLYYLSPEDQRPYRCRLDGSERQSLVVAPGVQWRRFIGVEKNDRWGIELNGQDAQQVFEGKNGQILMQYWNHPEVLESQLIEKPSPWNVTFTRKETGERVRMEIRTLLWDDAYLYTIWLPGDLAVVCASPAVFLLNLKTMEMGEIVRGYGWPLVLWENETGRSNEGSGPGELESR